MTEEELDRQEYLEERAKEDHAIRESLERENDFYDKLHFPKEWHDESRRLREAHAAEHFRDQEPGRFGDHASPARMRASVERDREEDRGY